MNKREDKKSFLMYLDYEEHFQYLTDNQLGKLIRIIYEYERSNEVPTIEDGVVLMAFSFIKSQLDRDKDKYEKEIVKRKMAGKKGSDARWKDLIVNSNTKNEIDENSSAKYEMANDSIAIKSIVKNSKCKNEIAKIADTDNVKDNETVIDNVAVGNKNLNAVILKYYTEQTKESPPAVAISSLLVFNFSEDIIKKAIDIAVLRKKVNLDYISGILKSWSLKGFTTLDEISKENKNSTEFDNLYDN